MDTITIVGFGVEKKDTCGFLMAMPAFNERWIKIKHLPRDDWSRRLLEITIRGDTTIHQELFRISKHPQEETIDYSVCFKDFYSTSNKVIGEFHKDTFTINGFKISNYFILKHDYPERVLAPKQLETLYWTDQYGLTAYKCKDGEIWTIRNDITFN